MKRRRLRSLAAAIALLTTTLPPQPAESTATRRPTRTPTPVLFRAIDSPITGGNLADLGAADANGDGHLDLFTTNHNFRANLLLAIGDGHFVDRTEAYGLSVNPMIPGIEAASEPPPTDEPNLYLYFQGDRMIVRTTTSEQRFAGRLHFTRSVSFQADGAMVVNPPAKQNKAGKYRAIDFAAEAPGVLSIEPWFPRHQITLRLDPNVPVERVRLGGKALPAPSSTITLGLVDRHGMAWSDFDGDGDLDLFLSRGGMVGMAPPKLNDEFFVHENNALRNKIATLGVTKNRGRSRRAAWLDFDNDGDLDLYIGNVDSPNRLWRQGDDGDFEDVAPAHRLDLKGGDVFRWVDTDLDGDLDLIATRPGDNTLHFVNQAGDFSKRILEDCPTIKPNRLAPADFDGDGDIDVFVADSGRNRILVADNGSFTCPPATDFGLPIRSATANWVDFDNDGLLDIHLLPGGLRRQLLDGRFFYAGVDVSPQPNIARCVWLDLDGDGARDCICEISRDGYLIEHRAWRNEQKTNHWLHVDLAGPAQNRQAIGARLIARMIGPDRLRRRKSSHIVGESDGAHWSQGHYRLYIGLGNLQGPIELEVFWPDGRRQLVTAPEADRRIEIRYDESKKIQAPPR